MHLTHYFILNRNELTALFLAQTSASQNSNYQYNKIHIKKRDYISESIDTNQYLSACLFAPLTPKMPPLESRRLIKGIRWRDTEKGLIASDDYEFKIVKRAFQLRREGDGMLNGKTIWFEYINSFSNRINNIKSIIQLFRWFPSPY